MQQPQPLPAYQHIGSTDSKQTSHSHSYSHSQSLPHSPSPANIAKQQPQPVPSKPNLLLPSSLSTLPPVPSHSLKPSSLSPSSRNNHRVSPSPSPPLPALPPPLPSKPPSRSRPSSASRTRLTKAEGQTDDSTASQATSVASEAIVTHVSPLSTARHSVSKKLKTESPPPLLPPPAHPSFVNGGMSLSHLHSDEDDGECTIITTTIVTATEREETRQHVHNTNHSSGQREETEGEEREPGAPETEDDAGSRNTGPRLGLRLGGFEEAKEEASEISTIPVFREEQKEERRKPKLTLQHLSSHSSSSPHQLPRLPLSLPATSSRPHTPQKGLHLHADDTPSGDGDSIIITTTTTTTTTTTSTQMRLLPLAATTPSSSSSAPFVPTKQSNMATTQSTSSRAAKLDFFLHDCTLITPTLYIGGQIVASDRALLHQHGITHVVNACGAVCDNYFPEDFSYYRLYLQDKGSEDVLCILYEVYHFIAAARASGGKTLIHCQQGVSRSTVLGIGYLMMAGEEGSEDSEWTYADYQLAYSRVRSKRGISSPNLGFVCQLLAWSRRLLGRCAFSSSLYRFAPHNSNDRKLVNKWVDTLDSTAFDARVILLLQSPYAFYLWVGEDVSAEREAASQPLIRRVIHNLQTYEFGVWKVIRIRRRTTEQSEDVTDLTHLYGLQADERPAVERRRDEIREHAPAAESDEDEGGVEGEGGGEEGDTDRMRERTNRTHAFDPDQPAEFFYAVMGGRPSWHTHNSALNDEVDADVGVDTGEERGRGMSRAPSLRSAGSSSTSTSSQRISVSVQKLQISPTLSAADRRTSAPSLSISPRSRQPSTSVPMSIPPLPMRPPRKDSRGEPVM